MPDDISTGELARQVQEVLVRFEGLAKRLESGQFVRTDVFTLYKETVSHTQSNLDLKLRALDESKAQKESIRVLEEKIDELEDDKKWLTRLVLGFIVISVVGLLLATSGGVI